MPPVPDHGIPFVPRQLALPFAHPATYLRHHLLSAGSNAEARHWLANPQTWPAGRLALWGEEGCGKSHLAHLWAKDHGVLLHGAALAMPPPHAPAYAVDDADTCLDERPLLHLLNLCAEAHRPVLLIGRAAPARWPNRLADLVSRLRAILAVEIGPPDDELLKALLGHQLAERQLVVTQAVQDFLLIRLPRTAGSIRAVVEVLDRLSLEQGRPITRDVAAHALATLHGDDVSMSWRSSPARASPDQPTLL